MPEAQAIPDPQHDHMTPEQLVDALYDTKQRIAELNRQIKEIEIEKTAFEDQLIHYKMENPTCKKIGTDKATVTFGEDTYYSINPENDAEFFQFVKDMDAFYFLQRRLNSAAIKESLSQGLQIPGISAFAKVKIGIRKA